MDRTWQVTRLHHVAFAHSGDSPPQVIGDLLGLTCTHEEHAAGFVERMLPAGESYLQLLEATGPGTVARFVDRRGPALHHVAIEVSDIDEAVSDLRRRGVRMVDETPRPGGMGTRIAFVHPASCQGLLVELVEPTDGRPERRAGSSHVEVVGGHAGR
jgi:methylmalonyl-CoA/ethylmalonyl-CoA epimerase